MDNPYDAAVQQREAQNLRRILWLNAFLDVLYVTGGGWLARNRGQDKLFWRGIGRGIMLQGVMLFVFDVLHARQVPD
ncbi:MAG: hypothetical protein K8L99_21930 [Anaerolineae bacterium]|nr:hypothetical protein [Anaerolineae bacterium]